MRWAIEEDDALSSSSSESSGETLSSTDTWSSESDSEGSLRDFIVDDDHVDYETDGHEHEYETESEEGEPPMKRRRGQ